MDLPKAKLYGIACPVCEQAFYNPSQQKIELMCTVSFADKGGKFIKTNFGILIGYGNFPHTCVSEDRIIKETARRNRYERN